MTCWLAEQRVYTHSSSAYLSFHDMACGSIIILTACVQCCALVSPGIEQNDIYWYQVRHLTLCSDEIPDASTWTGGCCCTQVVPEGNKPEWSGGQRGLHLYVQRLLQPTWENKLMSAASKANPNALLANLSQEALQVDSNHQAPSLCAAPLPTPHPHPTPLPQPKKSILVGCGVFVDVAGECQQHSQHDSQGG